MRRLLALLILLAAPAWATTYYVDCASSGGDGTTTATSGANAAFATVAAAQAALTGDQHDNSLLFIRGCTWREQFTVGAHGTSGHPFTIGKYGSSGAAPIINAADDVKGLSWVENGTVISGGDDGSPRDDHDTNTTTYLNTGNPISATGTINHIEFYINDIVSSKLFKLGVFYNTTGNNFAPRNYVSVTISGAAGAKITLDAPGNFTAFAATAGDLVGVYGNSLVRLQRGLTGGVNQRTYAGDGTVGEETYGTSTAGYHTALYMSGTGSGGTNQWQATVSTQPYQVYFNGSRGTPVASVALVNGAGKWYWAANVLTVYSTSNPSTAFTSLEASA
jgi:hypothetical protein